MAEYMLVPASGIEAGCLFKSDGEVPSEQLALAEPLGCCLSRPALARASRSTTSCS